ncbi:hypothetical protein N9242_01000, partial [Vicingaceae bacterium]|nr:hypothetical protein [Vicingaceae bacterium]
MKSVEDDLKISSITAIDSDGKELEIIANPINVGKSTSARYPLMITDRIRVTIDHPLANILELEDLVTIEVSLNNYNTVGNYVSKETSVNFNKSVTLTYSVENILDSFIGIDLHLSTVNNYGNIIYSSVIPISINDDGWMIQQTSSDFETELAYEPVEETMYILIDGAKVDKFEVEGKIVRFSKPEGYSSYIIYKPTFTESGKMYEISKNIKMTPSYGLVLRDDYCEKIIFSIVMNIYNTSITSINHTPIVKSLGLMTSDL